VDPNFFNLNRTVFPVRGLSRLVNSVSWSSPSSSESDPNSAWSNNFCVLALGFSFCSSFRSCSKLFESISFRYLFTSNSSGSSLFSGDTQGNTPSPVPVLYNLAQKIFLFKLELCPEIKSVFVNHLIPRPIAAPILANGDNGEADNNVDILNDILTTVSDEEDITFRNESKKETDKAEGFADETTGLTLFEYESLSAIKNF
jgi:hypothetical protein